MTSAPQKTMSSDAWVSLGMLSVVWGCVFLAIRVSLDELGPFTVVAFRIVLALPVLWAALVLMGLRMPGGWRLWGAFAVMGVLNNITPFSLQAWGQTHIESGLVAIFNAATAIFGMLVAAIFMADERLTARKLIGTALGFAGVLTAIGWDALRGFDIRSLAQLAVIASTVSYAFAGVWARRHLSHLRPQVAATGMLTCSAVMILPIAYLTEGAPSLDLAGTTWIALGYTSIIATAGAYLLYYRVLALAGSANLMLCTLIIPPVAIVLGALVRDETLGASAYAGFALLACGLLVIDGRVLGRKRVPVAPPRG